MSYCHRIKLPSWPENQAHPLLRIALVPTRYRAARPDIDEPFGAWHLYADASASDSNQKGCLTSWAYVLVAPDGTQIEQSRNGTKGTSINRMEMAAVVFGLHAIKRPSIVVAYTDSLYVLDSAARLTDPARATWKHAKESKIHRIFRRLLMKHTVDLVQVVKLIHVPAEHRRAHNLAGLLTRRRPDE